MAIKNNRMSSRGEPVGKLSGPTRLSGGRRAFLGTATAPSQEIFRISADMIEQGEKHPLTDRRHPMHKAALEEYSRLHREAAAAAPPNPVPASFNETERQKRRVKEANELMNLLVKDHNYQRAQIRPDINESDVRGLRQHKLVATRQYSRLASELDTDFRDIGPGVPRHIRETLDHVRGQDGSSDDFTAESADHIVRWVTREKRKRGFKL